MMHMPYFNRFTIENRVVFDKFILVHDLYDYYFIVLKHCLELMLYHRCCYVLWLMLYQRFHGYIAS